MADDCHNTETDVRRLRLAPGDVLVAKIAGDFDQVDAELARDTLRKVLDDAGPPDVAVVILSDELELVVLTADQVAELEA
jgi:hypothetical protein